ncbi:MAG: maleylacetate reductase [Herminiimonas sp.]|nr:maleylacetate reductase [Herminiimonas sp.]
MERNSNGEWVFGGQIPRIVFGIDSLQHLPREMALLDATRALVLCTSSRRENGERIAALIGDRCVGIFDEAEMHVPVVIAKKAVAKAAELAADCVIAIGGGSTIGLAKAIALESSLPVIAIPTTYSGSEMTPIFGMTESGCKTTGKDVRVLPRTVLYDPSLTLALRAGVSVTSGINAMAHACEGLYAADANPITSMWAVEGLRALTDGLPRVVRNTADIDARSECLYGAWLCGAVLGNASVGLHHKLCHTLGGTCNLPHAETHTVVLPHALAYNAAFAPEALRQIADALGVTDAPQGLFDLAKSLGAPTALKDIGMQENDIDRCVEIAVQNPYANPAPIEAKRLRVLLENAYHGRRPSSAA